MGLQIAPKAGVLLVLLCFFILTWSFARKDLELDVKAPTAENAKKSVPVVNQTVLNVKADGSIVWNHKVVTPAELVKRLKELSSLFPDCAIILRGDKNAKFELITAVLDILREANIPVRADLLLSFA